jgi:hypothetical protein
MFAVNFEQTLTELARHAPFRPFVVELGNGERIEVDHPEALAFRNMRAIFITKEGQAHDFDAESVTRIVGP